VAAATTMSAPAGATTSPITTTTRPTTRRPAASAPAGMPTSRGSVRASSTVRPPRGWARCAVRPAAPWPWTRAGWP
jgi:hypothetical protein